MSQSWLSRSEAAMITALRHSPGKSGTNGMAGQSNDSVGG